MTNPLHHLEGHGFTLLELLDAVYEYDVIPDRALSFLQGHGLLAAEEALTTIDKAYEALNTAEQPACTHLVDVMVLMCAHFHAFSHKAVRDPTRLVGSMHDVLGRALEAAVAEEETAEGEEVAS